MTSVPKRVRPARAVGRSPTPLYHQIFLQLRQEIADGAHAEGSILPGEFEVARRFAVSRITAGRAMDELARAGYVTRHPGRGTRVVWTAPLAPVEASVDSMLASVRSIGRTRVRVIAFGYVPAPPDVAAALALAAAAEVQRAERVRSIGATPLSHVVTHVPAAIGRAFGAPDLGARPLFELLAERGHLPCRGENRLSATAADGRIAALLEVEPGAPLLKATGVLADSAGFPVEHVVALYRPDRFQFTIRFAGGRGIGDWTEE